MVASSYKVKGILDQELEQELMRFTTKYGERKTKANSAIEQTQKKIYRDADVEVDIITGRTQFGGDGTVETVHNDSTESSSSFDGSDCGFEDLDASGETEVLSGSRVDAESAMAFDAFGEFCRMGKKTPTNHWRSFIKPLMWRCKWVELQIKKFEAEAQKYDRELERHSKQKLARLDRFPLDDLGVKSLPFSENRVRKEIFMRKKRRKDEATEDLTAYMSRHNLFTYIENRGCLTNDALKDIGLKSHAKAKAKATPNVNSDDEFWGNKELVRVEDGDDDDDDDVVENIFRKIDFLRSRVGELKSRADKLTDENGSYSSSPSNDVSTDEDDDDDGLPVGAYIVSQLVAEYKLSERIVPENAVKSCQEVVRDDNARVNRVYFDPIENDDYGILIDNPRMEEQMYNFEELKYQPFQRPISADSNRPTDDQGSPITNSILKNAMNPESTNKRKRDGSRVRFAI